MSDITRFDFDAGEQFALELQRRHETFESGARPEELRAEVGDFINIGPYSLVSYLAQVQSNFEFVDGVIAGGGSAPLQVFDHENDVTITVPKIDGVYDFSGIDDSDLQWILENAPEFLINADGVPPELSAEAMHNFQVMNAEEFVVLSASTSTSVTVDIAWVELGAGLYAGIEIRADGSQVITYRMSASAAAQADVAAAEAKVGVNGSLTWQFTYEAGEVDQALLLLDQTQTALTDDLNPLDINEVFDRHSENQTGFTTAVGVEASAGTQPPAVPDPSHMSAKIAIGAELTWNSISGVHTRGLSVSGNMGDTEGSISITESFAQNGARASVELEIDVSAPHELGLPINGGSASVSVDMSDPRAVDAYEEFLSNPTDAAAIAGLVHASTVTVSTTRSVLDEDDDFEFGAGPAKVEVGVAVEVEAGLVTEVKPPHTGEFIPVSVVSTVTHTVVDQYENHLENELTGADS